MAVVCACIPSLRPLFSVIGQRFSHAPGGRIASSGNWSAKHIWGSGVTSSNNDFSHLDDADDLRPLGHGVAIRGGKNDATQADEEGIEMPENGIAVKTEVILSTSDRLEYNDRLF